MKPTSLTELIKQTGVSLNANTILTAIKKTDLVEEVEYLSSTGSGEIKTFLRLTESGLKFGMNRILRGDVKTEPRFYFETFPQLLRVIVDQIDSEVRGLGA